MTLRILAITLAACFLAAAPLPVRADAFRDAMLRCADQQDGPKRLRCYDMMIKSVEPENSVGAAASPPVPLAGAPATPAAVPAESQRSEYREVALEDIKLSTSRR